MSISRFFSDQNFIRIKKDFQFLVTFVKRSFGEYELAIRDNYFNLYYKGYSIGKIRPCKDGLYEFSIHQKFFHDTKAYHSDSCQGKSLSNSYYNVLLTPKQLHPFLQKIHLSEFASKVSELPSGEIALEQSIITDNLNREDLLIIDRQITDTELQRQRMDLLALVQIKENRFQFQVLEVKLGNNIELSGKVYDQLNGYISHIEREFENYKFCYERQYVQKKELGLIDTIFDHIDIIKPVIGRIIVGSYSLIASDKIANLKKVDPNLNIKTFTFKLD